ncbi:MAG TPA: glycosyltransferase, partial [Candidatus Saccharimonadaceae bacterium]|nr:glycosyltransferase [Candidatus Saccharimonadaceae bacterium]
MKICIVYCYSKYPDYIRVKMLRETLMATEGVEVVYVKYTQKSVLRYIEVLWETFKVRLSERPDAYLLAFRGYELLPAVRVLTLGKPFIYDEFINPLEWVFHEHAKFKAGGIIEKITRSVYRFWCKSTTVILADTASHADISAELSGISRSHYMPLIVSTDETLFAEHKSSRRTTGQFNVFYYGNMLPLHGAGVVIEAMKLLQDKDISLTLIGGKENTAQSVEVAVKSGAKIEYKSWVEFDELPGYMQRADVCLAGPFGGTYQAQFVITGKAYQYLQMGRPTIIGANKESHIFTDRENALVVEQNSPQALAAAITWTYEHRSELERIGQAGHELYQAKLS